MLLQLVQKFNLISLLVLVIILVTGLLFIHFSERKEMKRLQKRYDDLYPSAGKKKRKYPMIVDAKLSMELDDHERALSN